MKSYLEKHSSNIYLGNVYFLTSAKGNVLQINKLNGNGTIGTRLTALGKEICVYWIHLLTSDAEGAIEAPGMFRVNGQ
jgi:hypothetical protein